MTDWHETPAVKKKWNDKLILERLRLLLSPALTCSSVTALKFGAHHSITPPLPLSLPSEAPFTDLAILTHLTSASSLTFQLPICYRLRLHLRDGIRIQPDGRAGFVRGKVSRRRRSSLDRPAPAVSQQVGQDPVRARRDGHRNGGCPRRFMGRLHSGRRKTIAVGKVQRHLHAR